MNNYNRLDSSGIDAGSEVKAYLYGDTIEFVSNTFEKTGIRAIKIDKNYYNVVDTETGEVVHSMLEYRHESTRKDNLSNVRRTMRKVSRLINNNFDGSPNELWLTLTYAKNERDTSVVYKDFKNFMAKLRRSTGKSLEYISVIEPQERGAWHCHVLLKDFNSSNLWIDKNEIARCWGKGFINVKKLKSGDNVAAYLTAYLTNLEYDDEDDDGNTVKAIKKGARLHLYPSGVNIYRSSRGIKKPKEVNGYKGDFDIDDYALKYSAELEYDDGSVFKEIYRREE